MLCGLQYIWFTGDISVVHREHQTRIISSVSCPVVKRYYLYAFFFFRYNFGINFLNKKLGTLANSCLHNVMWITLVGLKKFKWRNMNNIFNWVIGVTWRRPYPLLVTCDKVDWITSYKQQEVVLRLTYWEK